MQHPRVKTSPDPHVVVLFTRCCDHRKKWNDGSTLAHSSQVFFLAKQGQTIFNCWACRQSEEVGLKVQPDRVVKIAKG